MLNRYTNISLHLFKKLKGIGNISFGWIAGISATFLILLWVNIQYDFKKNIPSDGVWYASETSHYSIKKEVVRTIITTEIALEELNKKEITIQLKTFVCKSKVLLFSKVLCPISNKKSQNIILI